MTFLRRAKPEELDAIPIDKVSDSLRTAVEESGFSIEDAALERAASATAGYAYLIQLVGYHIWRAAWLRCRERSDGGIVISSVDAEKGIGEAMEEFKEAVLETAIAGLPRTAVEFALAMSEAPGRVVSTSDIAARLGKSTGYLSSSRLPRGTSRFQSRS